MWALIAIGVACLLVLLCCCYCICKRCICKKRKGKDGKKGLKASLKPGLEFALKKENVSPCSNVRAQLECLDFNTVCWQTYFISSPLREHVCMYSLKQCVRIHLFWSRSDHSCFQSNLQHILIFFLPVIEVKSYSFITLFKRSWLPHSKFLWYLDIL